MPKGPDETGLRVIACVSWIVCSACGAAPAARPAADGGGPDAAPAPHAGADAAIPAPDAAPPTPACTDEAALELYRRRIEPLLTDEQPRSCNQCHLSGIDLGLFLRDTPCQTMGCLQQRGLVDLEQPGDSVVLAFIRRAQPASELITAEVIEAEYQAFAQWVEYHARCGQQVCEPTELDACAQSEIGPLCGIDGAIVGGFDDPGDCSDATLEHLFASHVYRWRGRCYPCHFERDSAVPVAPKWISEAFEHAVTNRDARCHAAALQTLRNVVRNGYVELDAPAQSLLVRKPLATAYGGVVHGGHDKFEGLDDPAYIDFLHFVTRYAQCATRRPELPRPARNAGSSTDVDAGPTSPILEYCNCMLLRCHDEFHAQWGQADEDAIAGCRVAALSLPASGQPEVSGNLIECRLNYCRLADVAPDACAAALGDEPCR